jgi:hypothetical protein
MNTILPDYGAGFSNINTKNYHLFQEKIAKNLQNNLNRGDH